MQRTHPNFKLYPVIIIIIIALLKDLPNSKNKGFQAPLKSKKKSFTNT